MPPKNDQRGQNWSNSVSLVVVVVFLLFLLGYANRKMGKWADEGDGLNVDSVGLVQFLTRCWPLTFSGHSQRRRLAANSSFSSSLPSSPSLSLSQSAFAFTLTSHVAIRQRFNRVCAFAWKSLKLNASDGNLYASPTQATPLRGEGARGRDKSELCPRLQSGLAGQPCSLCRN